MQWFAAMWNGSARHGLNPLYVGTCENGISDTHYWAKVVPFQEAFSGKTCICCAPTVVYSIYNMVAQPLYTTLVVYLLRSYTSTIDLPTILSLLHIYTLHYHGILQLALYTHIQYIGIYIIYNYIWDVFRKDTDLSSHTWCVISLSKWATTCSLDPNRWLWVFQIGTCAWSEIAASWYGNCRWIGLL